MKIVYIASFKNTSHEKGVINKLIWQKKSLEKYGHNVKIITFSDIYTQKNIDNINLLCLSNYEENNIINKIYINYVTSKELVKVVEKENPDCIYIRDLMWYFNLYNELSRIAKVFIEVQTNIFYETKLINKKRYYLEKFTKRNYLKSITGIVGITDEICKFEYKYNKKPNFVLGNGIDESEVNFINKKSENKLINMLFIGSPDMPWHGVERLLESYLNSKIKEKFILHIVGYENKYNLDNNNVKFYGFVSDKEKIDELISISDIGIGSLALYKNNMKEAATLKVRQYLAKGLPIIIGYNDVDLIDNSPFVLNVPNNESLLNYYEIENFYNKTRSTRTNGDTIKYVIDNLTWDKKMIKLLEFITHI